MRSVDGKALHGQKVLSLPTDGSKISFVPRITGNLSWQETSKHFRPFQHPGSTQLPEPRAGCPYWALTRAHTPDTLGARGQARVLQGLVYAPRGGSVIILLGPWACVRDESLRLTLQLGKRMWECQTGECVCARTMCVHTHKCSHKIYLLLFYCEN